MMFAHPGNYNDYLPRSEYLVMSKYGVPVYSIHYNKYKVYTWYNCGTVYRYTGKCVTLSSLS